MQISLLWKAPAINPVNKKALSVPVLNPIDKYGRMFYFSTFGFMIAFLSWYAFPPLMTRTIKKDLHLSQAEVANSNIMALTATLVVRLITGPLCDRFGPRYVFAGVLLAGAIPTALAGTVTNATGLLILRFFVGILGASFVPCQVWSTGFYDKRVVGTANGLMAGIGNAGGGITYFIMPAVFDSFVKDRGLTPHVAWRVSFIVPFILITATAIGMLLFCEDTPTGPWSERHLHAREDAQTAVINGVVPDYLVPHSEVTGERERDYLDEKKKEADIEAGTPDSEVDVTTVITSEVVQAPTLREGLRVIFSLQAVMLAAPYACSFGGELAINSILGAYYNQNFPKLGQTKSGQWAAMFGLVNVLFRPLGGIIADIIYRASNSVQAKKFWLIFVCLIMSVFCIIIGFVNSHHMATMIGLVLGLAIFMDAANGANFAVVPHVFPHANGVLSGFVGASGNLGGIIFSIIFRYNGTDYAKSIWISGFVMMGLTIAISWIPPIPRGQLSH